MFVRSLHCYVFFLCLFVLLVLVTFCSFLSFMFHFLHQILHNYKLDKGILSLNWPTTGQYKNIIISYNRSGNKAHC